MKKTIIYTASEDREDILVSATPKEGYSPLIVLGVSNFKGFLKGLEKFPTLRLKYGEGEEPETAEFDKREVHEVYEEIDEDEEYVMSTDSYYEDEDEE